MDRLTEDQLSKIEVQIEDEQRCVKYDIREFTIEYYVDKYSKGVKNDTNELYVPEYQREFIWTDSRQSRFIESLLLGLPVPLIFVSLDKLETRLIHLHISGIYKDVTSTNKILEISKVLYRKATNKESVLIEKLGFNTSGNVDYDYFQKIVGSIGCRGRINIDEKNVKVAMLRTKEHRNKLAHGNCSFSSAGSILTLQQICEDYDCVVDFLKQSLDNLEAFLDNKKYLKGKE